MKTLEPKAVWQFFHEITQIPRPSKKEEQIIAFLKEFGKSHHLSTKIDATGNVLICKPATQGFEDKKTTILQAHSIWFARKTAIRYLILTRMLFRLILMATG